MQLGAGAGWEASFIYYSIFQWCDDMDQLMFAKLLLLAESTIEFVAIYYFWALWNARTDTEIPVGYWIWYLLRFTSLRLQVIIRPASVPTAIVDPSEQNAIDESISFFYNVITWFGDRF